MSRDCCAMGLLAIFGLFSIIRRTMGFCRSDLSWDGFWSSASAIPAGPPAMAPGIPGMFRFGIPVVPVPKGVGVFIPGVDAFVADVPPPPSDPVDLERCASALASFKIFWHSKSFGQASADAMRMYSPVAVEVDVPCCCTVNPMDAMAGTDPEREPRRFWKAGLLLLTLRYLSSDGCEIMLSSNLSNVATPVE